MDRVGLQEVEVCNIGMLSFKLAHVSNVLELVVDKGMVWITLAVDESKNSLCLVPSVLACQPSWRFREGNHAEKQKEGWNDLETPRDSEGCRVVVVGLFSANVAASKADIVPEQEGSVNPYVGNQPLGIPATRFTHVHY